jgi:hypothetical protein
LLIQILCDWVITKEVHGDGTLKKKRVAGD